MRVLGLSAEFRSSNLQKRSRSNKSQFNLKLSEIDNATVIKLIDINFTLL